MYLVKTTDTSFIPVHEQNAGEVHLHEMKSMTQARRVTCRRRDEC